MVNKPLHDYKKIKQPKSFSLYSYRYMRKRRQVVRSTLPEKRVGSSEFDDAFRGPFDDGPDFVDDVIVEENSVCGTTRDKC